MRATGNFWGVLLSFWLAVLFCAFYATVGYLFIRWSHGAPAADSVLQFFLFEYGGMVSGTACAALFLISTMVLQVIPKLIEDAVPAEQFESTAYVYWKERSLSFRLSLAQFSTYFFGGVAIYTILGFPVQVGQQWFFVVFTALQYSFGGIVGRKLWSIGHMLRSLEDVEPGEDLLENESLPKLIYIINIFTFLTLVMTVLHTYFHAQVTYSSHLADLLKPLVYLPLILALPVVVLFNFYPRMVVNKLYLRSIRQKKRITGQDNAKI